MKNTLFILGILLLVSCTSKTILEKPADLIPKDSMVLLLTDLYIAKSAHGEKNLNNERKINYTRLVYNKYKIDSIRFIRSNFYYTSKLETYDLIFKEVNGNLSLKKVALEKEIKQKSKLTDPLKETDDEDFENQ
jgi:hypothetical protein